MEIDVSKLFDINVPQPAVEAGMQLVASPQLGDPAFRRTVIHLVSHRRDGSMGLVVNRSFGLRLGDLFPHYPNADAFPIYCGGPVGLDTLFVLHRLPSSKLPDAEPIGNGFRLGGDSDLIRHLVETGEATPAELRFIVGYSGWSEGQLEEEISLGAWAVLTAPLLPEQVFCSLPSRLWNEAVTSLGDDFAVWQTIPELLILN